MYSSALTARVVFLVVWCECVQLVRREGVRVREEWRGADRLPPQLSLHTAHLQDVCVQVRLRVLPLQANENLTIDFRDSETDSDTLVLLVWKQDGVRWCVKSGSDDLCQPHTARLQTREHERPIVNMTSHQAFWNLRYNCFPARTGSTVTVSVHRDEDLLISGSHVVQLTEPVDKDPVPEAGVSVDERQKRFTVRMETDQTVKIGLCYKQSSHECKVLKDVKKINKTTVNQTVDLSFPFLIPCVCVQLWFTVTDARRNTLCPLKERILPHGGDILSSSSARVLGSVLLWEPVCRDDQSDPSVSLCWRIHTQNSYCVPAPNATLYGTKREYNVSAADQHPQMCVKFSLNGSHRVFCPFESERRSKWSVTVVPGSLRLHVHLTSDIAASFAAQLCDRDGDTCASRGHVFSRQLDGGATEAELSLPFPFLSSGLCVQVWRRDLHGRRIICPDFTHRRWGFVVGAALTLLAAVIVLVRFARWLLKKIPSVWRSERRPVLLVCSSNDAPHVAAVCSLASGLQGELCMDVRLAQWMQCHAPLSLAQLGPVPWLYGQCQAVQKAGGLVLIAWSPDARRAYLRWRKSELCKTGLYGAVEEDEEEQMCCDEERREKPTESSSITAPVFSAALSSLWMGIRGDGHGRGFGLVCFPSLDNNVSRIPKRLRCVRKYCLPKDLSSLIHDLTGSRDGAGKTRGRCWPRLLSKALSFFASRQLAPRLEAKLPVPTGSPKLPSMLSKKSSTNGNKGKTWRQKKRRSKVVSSFLSRKGCLKKKTPELHTPLES